MTSDHSKLIIARNSEPFSSTGSNPNIVSPFTNSTNYHINIRKNDIPLHVLPRNKSEERPLTVFEKPVSGPLLYVRRPVSRQNSLSQSSNDDEETVQKDTVRRQELAERIRQAEKNNAEVSPIITQERARREKEQFENLRANNYEIVVKKREPIQRSTSTITYNYNNCNNYNYNRALNSSFDEKVEEKRYKNLEEKRQRRIEESNHKRRMSEDCRKIEHRRRVSGITVEEKKKD